MPGSIFDDVLASVGGPKPSLGIGTIASPRLVKGAVYEPFMQAAQRLQAKYPGWDPEYTRRQIKQESGGNVRARSFANAYGPAQITPATAARFGYRHEEMSDPAKAADVYEKYMDKLLTLFGGDIDKAIASFNAGEGAVQKFGLEKVRSFSNFPKGDPRRGGYAGSTGEYVDNITGRRISPSTTPGVGSSKSLFDDVLASARNGAPVSITKGQRPSGRFDSSQVSGTIGPLVSAQPKPKPSGFDQFASGFKWGIGHGASPIPSDTANEAISSGLMGGVARTAKTAAGLAEYAQYGNVPAIAFQYATGHKGAQFQHENITGPVSEMAKGVEEAAGRRSALAKPKGFWGGVSFDVLQGASGAAIDLPRLAAGSLAFGPANLPLQFAAESKGSGEGLGGQLYGAGSGLFYHWGMGLTSPLGRLKNALIWGPLAGAQSAGEQAYEGKEIDPALVLSSGLTMGGLSALGSRRAKVMTEEGLVRNATWKDLRAIQKGRLKLVPPTEVASQLPEEALPGPTKPSIDPATTKIKPLKKDLKTSQAKVDGPQSMSPEQVLGLDPAQAKPKKDLKTSQGPSPIKEEANGQFSAVVQTKDGKVRKFFNTKADAEQALVPKPSVETNLSPMPSRAAYLETKLEDMGAADAEFGKTDNVRLAAINDVRKDLAKARGKESQPEAEADRKAEQEAFLQSKRDLAAKVEDNLRTKLSKASAEGLAKLDAKILVQMMHDAGLALPKSRPKKVMAQSLIEWRDKSLDSMTPVQRALEAEKDVVEEWVPRKPKAQDKLDIVAGEAPAESFSIEKAEGVSPAVREGEKPQFTVADEAPYLGGKVIKVIGPAVDMVNASTSRPEIGETRARLADIYVKPEFQRKGIGSQILRGILDRFIAHGDAEFATTHQLGPGKALLNKAEREGWITRVGTENVPGTSPEASIYRINKPSPQAEPLVPAQETKPKSKLGKGSTKTSPVVEPKTKAKTKEVAPGIVLRRTVDFQEDGTYDVTIDGTQGYRIHRSPAYANGGLGDVWMLSHESKGFAKDRMGQPDDVRNNLGYTRKEALEELRRRHDESIAKDSPDWKLQSPSIKLTKAEREWYDWAEDGAKDALNDEGWIQDNPDAKTIVGQLEDMRYRLEEQGRDVAYTDASEAQEKARLKTLDSLVNKLKKSGYFNEEAHKLAKDYPDAEASLEPTKELGEFRLRDEPLAGIGEEEQPIEDLGSVEQPRLDIKTQEEADALAPAHDFAKRSAEEESFSQEPQTRDSIEDLKQDLAQLEREHQETGLFAEDIQKTKDEIARREDETIDLTGDERLMHAGAPITKANIKKLYQDYAPDFVKEIHQAFRSLLRPVAQAEQANPKGTDIEFARKGDQAQQSYAVDLMVQEAKATLDKMGWGPAEHHSFMDMLMEGTRPTHPELAKVYDTFRAADEQAYVAQNEANMLWSRRSERALAMVPERRRLEFFRELAKADLEGRDPKFSDPVLSKAAKITPKVVRGRMLDYVENHFRLFLSPIEGGTTQDRIKASNLARGRGGAMLGTKGQFRQRKFGTLTEAKEAGFKPQFDNAAEMIQHSLKDSIRYSTMTKALVEMRKLGKGMVQFVRSGGILKNELPEGFVRVADGAFRKYIRTKEGLHPVGEWVVEENVGRLLNNYKSKDYIRSSEVGRGVLAAKMRYTELELTLSGFHYALINQEANNFLLAQAGREALVGRKGQALKDLGTSLAGTTTSPFMLPIGGGAPKVKGLPAFPGSLYSLGDKLSKFQQGTISPEEIAHLKANFPGVDIEHNIKMMYRGGMVQGLHADYKSHAIERMRENWRSLKDDKSLKGGARLVFNMPFSAAEKLMGPIFDNYIPRIKNGAWMRDFEVRKLEKAEDLASGKVSEGQIARESTRHIENIFGEMNFDNLYWNRTFKTAAQLAFRSVTWQLGSMRLFGEGLAGPAIKNEWHPSKNPSTLMVGAIALNAAISGSIVSKVFSGKWPWEWDLSAGYGELVRNALFPHVSAEDKDQRVSQPNYMKVALHMYHAIKEGRFHIPTSYIGSSQSGIASRLYEIWENKDFYGTEVRNEKDSSLKQAWDIGTHMLPKPFSIASAQRMQQAGEKGWKGAMLSGLGLTYAPSFISETTAQQKMYKILQQERKIGSNTEETALIARTKSQLENMIRRGRYKDATTMLKSELDSGRLGPAQVKDIISSARFTRLQSGFKRLRLEDAVEVWSDMEPAEQAETREQYISKIRNTFPRLSPSDQERLKPLVLNSLKTIPEQPKRPTFGALQ